MNVLLLTDYSNNACVAHKYVFNLLKGQQVNYSLVNAYNIEQTNQLLKKQNSLQKNVQQLSSFLESLSTLSCIEEKGNLLDVVRKLILQLDINLVVMGAQGQSTNKRVSLGKNTNEIATKVKCPVLVVPEHTPIKTPIKINFPIDYKDRIHTNCISKIQDLPNWENMQITIQEVNSSDENSSQRQSHEILTDTLQMVKPKFKSTLIIDYAQLTENSDMVFVAAKNLKICNAIFNQLNQDNSQQISPKPLLVLHA